MIKKLLIKVLGLSPCYKIKGSALTYIDSDPDYRRTGKTTMRLNAAINHLRKDVKNRVLFISGSHRQSKMLRRIAIDKYFKYAYRITFGTHNDVIAGTYFSKIIHDPIGD